MSTPLEPIWPPTAPAGPTFEPLTQDLKVDIAIVGAGITGLTAAALLAEAGRGVAVIEAARLGGGVSGCTTAHLDYTTDTDFSKLISNFGEDGARRVVDASRHSIDLIEKLVGKYQIDCEFRRVLGYNYTESEKDFGMLEGELKAAQRLGVPVALASGTPLPVPARAALVFENEGRFHIMKYLYGLAGAITAAQGRIFEQTRIESVQDGSPARLKTAGGATITAREVILATHSPLGLRLSIHTRVAPYRSYVIAARLAEPVPEGIYWDCDEPYHYIRRFSDEDPTVALIGGEDHKTGHKENTLECFDKLEAWSRQRFNIQAIERRWSAQLFTPVDDLPYIGLDALSSHVYVATGFAGVGMTFGTAAAMILTDLITGHHSPAAQVFSPSRLNPVASAAKFVSTNLDVAKHFVIDWLAPGPKEALAQVPAGQGRVIEMDGRKVAVYREESGQVHALSPVCPHAKCIVSWNNAEQSWDCPCHGSRFRATGEVIEGPATTSLEPIK